MPEAFALEPLMRRVTLADGSAGIRFRPDSYPTLTAIRFCDGEDGTWSVLLDFSEVIDESADLAALVTIASGSSACKGYFQGRSLNFICDAFSADVTASISIASGLMGASGVPVTDMAGDSSYTFAIVPSLLPTIGQCPTLNIED